MEKDSYFIRLYDTENPENIGLGECSLIPGLSPDNLDDFEAILTQRCKQISEGKIDLDEAIPEYPSIQFGFETAALDLRSGGNRILHASDFTEGRSGIPINGLIWMASKTEMLQQIAAKIDQGFSILKLKVGAIDFEEEKEIIQSIRTKFTKEDLELRLDANGAWEFEEAKQHLELLSNYAIHSIEQPIAAGAPEEMTAICNFSPIPIALDEELIGVSLIEEKQQVLKTIKPAYIILKPSILGGIKASTEWIHLAEKQEIGWWVTSALESNIGLNAIAQWTATLNTSMPQGLGTGSLFSNNIPSPLRIIGDSLFYLPKESWDTTSLYNSYAL